jgi:hypothetical protein
VPAALAGVLALLVGGTALALSSGDTPDRAAAPATSSAPTAPAQTEAPAGPTNDDPDEQEPAPSADSDEEEPAVAGVPAGWSTDRGGAGWTVALPPGYRQTGAGEYVGPKRRTLRIDTTAAGGGKDDAVADREAQAQDFQRRHPSYQEIRIEAVDYRDYEAADWEFTYDGLHVLNRVFVVDGRGHSLFFQTPEDDFSQARKDFEAIAKAFQPVGA